MGHFLRIRKCCGCCGSLRGGSIAIGVFYLLSAIFGATIDDLAIYSGMNNNPYMSYSSDFGICGEVISLRIWRFSSLVSVFINLIMVYGALVEQALLVAPWLAWYLVMPFLHFALIVWSIVGLASCKGLESTYSRDVYALMITVLTTYVVSSLLLLYFATVVYSLYKDLSERSRNNMYGTGTLLPSRNWDAAHVPYTNYDPEQATPTAWGNLQPQQQTYEAPVQRIPHPPTQLLQRPISGIPRPQTQFTA